MKVQSNRQTWFWLIVLLIFFIMISIFSYSQEKKEYPAYVSDSPSPSGVKAFYTYLNKELKVKRWSATPQALPKSSKNNLLIMVEPSFIPDQHDMSTYHRFMEDGNTILLLMRNPKGMFDLNVKPLDMDPSFKANKVYDQYKNWYKADVNSSIRLLTEKSDEQLLYDSGGTIALKQKVGQGQLIVAITPEWMTNGQILKNGGELPLLLQILNTSHSKTVFFDEYLHTNQNTSTTLQLYPKWFLLILLQLLFLTILWLWYQGKRFGPIFVPREETVRFSDEGLRALSAWYLKGRRYHDSFLIQADYLRLLLQERWKIPYNREWKELSDYLQRRWLGIPNRDILPFIQGIESMIQKEKMSKQEYLQWSRKLELLRKEVEEG